MGAVDREELEKQGHKAELGNCRGPVGGDGKEGPQHAEGVEREGVGVLQEVGEEWEDVLCYGGVDECICLTLLVVVL